MAKAVQLAVPQTYAALRRAVEETLFKGQRAIEQAKVRTYHETGWYIKEHILLNVERADYGAKVYERLEKDLSISKRVLYQCAQFARMFPIVNGRSQLMWAHYRSLLRISDDVQRQAITLQADKEGWTSEDLDERVTTMNANLLDRSDGAANGTPGKLDLLKPIRGTPGLHRIVDKSFGPALSGVEGLSVDLGFRHYWPLSTEQAKRYAKGDIVRIGDDDSLRVAADATKADLFTYAAQLVRVVDGDTLVVALEISPGEFLEQKLRLRGLDAPEMSTPEGKAAKRFVEALLAKTSAIVINTTKPDKYDRYLADVFLMVTRDEGQVTSSNLQRSTLNAQPGATGSVVFLNNTLLETGHAVRKDASDFGDDWGFK